MIVVEKYQLLLAFRRMQDRPKGPSLELVALPWGIALALLLSLLPSEFEDYWGTPAETWEAFALIAFAASVIAGILLLGRWVYCLVRYPSKSEDELLEELINQINADRARAAAAASPAATALTPTPSPELAPDKASPQPQEEL